MFALFFVAGPHRRRRDARYHGSTSSCWLPTHCHLRLLSLWICPFVVSSLLFFLFLFLSSTLFGSLPSSFFLHMCYALQSIFHTSTRRKARSRSRTFSYVSSRFALSLCSRSLFSLRSTEVQHSHLPPPLLSLAPSFSFPLFLNVYRLKLAKESSELPCPTRRATSPECSKERCRPSSRLREVDRRIRTRSRRRLPPPMLSYVPALSLSSVLEPSISEVPSQRLELTSPSSPFARSLLVPFLFFAVLVGMQGFSDLRRYSGSWKGYRSHVLRSFNHRLSISTSRLPEAPSPSNPFQPLSSELTFHSPYLHVSDIQKAFISALSKYPNQSFQQLLNSIRNELKGKVCPSYLL